MSPHKFVLIIELSYVEIASLWSKTLWTVLISLELDTNRTKDDSGQTKISTFSNFRMIKTQQTHEEIGDISTDKNAGPVYQISEEGETKFYFSIAESEIIFFIKYEKFYKQFNSYAQIKYNQQTL